MRKMFEAFCVAPQNAPFLSCKQFFSCRPSSFPEAPTITNMSPPRRPLSGTAPAQNLDSPESLGQNNTYLTNRRRRNVIYAKSGEASLYLSLDVAVEDCYAGRSLIYLVVFGVSCSAHLQVGTCSNPHLGPEGRRYKALQPRQKGTIK